MKPNFALNFTDTSIALLHRTAKGWLKIGETPFDAPDLDEALDYLRKTALGLEPGGFTTKLVIPNSQILYAELEAPGPDETVRRQQISAALEGRTPYSAEEIVFDWSGRGRWVKVAAVARETLAEAESFAVTHRFNPVSFVAIPEGDTFGGEPWFGLPDAASALLDGAETVERDPQPISLLSDSSRKARSKVAPDSVEDETALTEAPNDRAEEEGAVHAPAEIQEEATFAADHVEAEAAEYPDEDYTPDVEPSAPLSTEEAYDFDDAAQDEPQADESEVEEPETPAPLTDVQDTFAAPHSTQQELRFEPEPNAPEEDNADEGYQDDARQDDRADDSSDFAHGASATQPGPALSISGVRATRAPARPTPSEESGPVPSILAPHAGSRAPLSAPAAGEAKAASVATPSVGTATVSAEGEVEEAPFAHVPDTDADQDDDRLDLRRRPASRLADRFAERMAREARSAPVLPPAMQAQDGEDDIPPAPAAAVLSARGTAGRWGASKTAASPRTPGQMPPPMTAPKGDAPSAGAAARGTVPPLNRPSATRVDPTLSAPSLGAAPSLGTTARGKPVEDLPPLPVNQPAAGAMTKSGTAAKSLAKAVTSPSLAVPGGRKNKAKVLPPDDQMPPPEEAALSLGRSPFAARDVQRGKPRHLGLILVAILVLCLALVAAWSSIYLASGGTEQSDRTVASASDAAADDSQLDAADDGTDPEALADGFDAGEEEATDLSVAEPTPEPDPGAEVAAERAPETAVQSDSPASVALADTQDEIFLSAADAPPPAFDALALPSPEATAEALPDTPMPPPPFGTVYEFDAQGLIVPQTSGIPSPEGYTIYAGKPKRVPPARPAAVEEAAVAASQAAEQAAAEAAAAASTTPAATDASAAGQPGQPVQPGPGNPSLVEAQPLNGAAGVTPLSPAANPALEAGTAGATAAAATAIEPETHPAQQPNPELSDRRPRSRPASLVPPSAEDDAAVTPASDTAPAQESQFAGLRPRSRSAAVTQAVEAAQKAAEAEANAKAAAEAELIQTAAAAAAADAGNPSLLAISRRPAQRPKDFSRAVEAAVAAAVRAPEVRPEPQPEPQQVAQPAPSKSKSKAPKETVIKPEEEDEINEPELAAAPAPKIPTKASVAKTATFTKAINLSKINLIGVYGSQSQRYALIRQTNGKYKKVKVGDKVDGGQIKAITQNEVRYQKGGRLLALQMPKG